MIDVQRVDYIRVPVTDIDAANHFYGEVLGLRRNPNSPSDDWVEYEAGNVTLAVMTPHTHEYEFAPLPPATLALRVPDVAEAKAEARGGRSGGQRDVGLGPLPRAPASAIPPATASSSTTATRRTRTGRSRDRRRRARRLPRVPVMDNATGDAHFRELGLWERNPRSTERWVEYEAPNVTLALVPNATRRPRARTAAVRGVRRSRRRHRGRAQAARWPRSSSSATDSTRRLVRPPFVGLDGNGMLLHHRYAPHRDGRSPEAPRGESTSWRSPTRDRDRAEEFYGGTLGLERNPNSSETWVEYETANVTLAPVDPVAAGQEFKPLPAGTIAFRVADVEAAAAELESAGVEFPAGVIDSGVCHLAPFSDPDGNGLMLHRRYAPFSDGTKP